MAVHLLQAATLGKEYRANIGVLMKIYLSDWFANRPEESHKCDDCKGAGCNSCGGFGWDFNDDACLLGAKGNHNSCPSNAKCKG